jgi:hypothetical protein
MITGSRYRNAPAYIMISIAVLSISLLIIYLENNLDLLAYPGINKDKFGISEVYPTANKGDLVL